jgi:hypothetical protein
VLAHVLYCWDYWLSVTHIPKKRDRRYAEALVLARRVLRSWRQWTVSEQLLAPTWQQIRLNARLLPPLSSPSVSTPPRTSPTVPRLQAEHSTWDRKIPLAIWRYGASPWRLTLQEHEEQARVISDYDRRRSASVSLLQDFDRRHPGNVMLRSWHTVDRPISRPHCPTVLWYESWPPPWHPTWAFGKVQRQDRYSHPPPKFRYVICHYGQPFSWHWIEAAPTFGPSHRLLATGWQERLLFTTVGSSSGSLTTQVHSFRAGSVHPGLFNTTAQVSPAIIASADSCRCTTVDVEEFTGAGELTSFTQRSEQTLISPQSDEESSESSSSEEDGDEDSVAPVFRSWQLSNPECVASLLTSRRTRREWELLGECWFLWRDLQKEINYRRFMGKVSEDDSDSECDPPRLSTQDFQIPKRHGPDCSSCSDDSFDSFGEDNWERPWWQNWIPARRNHTVSRRIDYAAQLNPPIQGFRATQDRGALDHARDHSIQFVEDRRCYFEGPLDSAWEFNHASDLFPDLIFPDSYLQGLSTSNSMPPPRTRKPWRAVGHITIDEADLHDTGELPSLAESDCAGELELIRYTEE